MLYTYDPFTHVYLCNKAHQRTGVLCAWVVGACVGRWEWGCGCG